MSKLVRDKIPEIIKKNDWFDPPFRIVEGELLKVVLDTKLDEEIAELRVASTDSERAEEIADVIEVLFAIGIQSGFTPEQIEMLRLQKKEKRWGFEKGIILEKW